MKILKYKHGKKRMTKEEKEKLFTENENIQELKMLYKYIENGNYGGEF